MTTLQEYKDQIAAAVANIEKEIASRYPGATIETSAGLFSKIKINGCVLNLDFPTLDYDLLNVNGVVSVYITTNETSYTDRPWDGTVVRQQKMLKVKTKKTAINYDGQITDAAAFVDYLAKRKKFKEIIAA